MLRLRRAGEINGEHVPEIILLNSHDGTSSYQMLPGYFRFVCQNGCVCGQSLGEVRVPHRGNVVDRVIEGAYEVVGVFDRIEEKRVHAVAGPAATGTPGAGTGGTDLPLW
ncbi:CP4-57 prophage protein [Escherichia coli]|nr:CP4-57 prophage protein [Escherichia coli]